MDLDRTIRLCLLTLPILLSGCAGCSYESDPPPIAMPDYALETRREPTGPEQPAGNCVVVKMKKEDGIYKVPVKINGTEMDFYFDTGAGMISMSQVEAAFLLKNGKITSDDLIGTHSYSTASGDVGRASLVNLREVSIGGRTIQNVEASIVDNPAAPLLLGQSLLSRFGKISIDYAKSEIVLE